MILSFSRQAAIFLMTVGLGAACGVFYDVLRALRKLIDHRPAVVHLEDGIFWLWVVLLVFYVMQSQGGEIRFFVVTGTILGMVLYFFTLSRLILPAFLWLFAFIGQVVFETVKILLFPIKKLVGLLGTIVRFHQKKMDFTIKSSKKLLQSFWLYVKMKISQTGRQFDVILKKK